jgi:hypothetical protein
MRRWSKRLPRRSRIWGLTAGGAGEACGTRAARRGSAALSVKGFKQPVIFRRQDGRTAEVEAGPLRMKVPLADILRIESRSKDRRFR